MLDNPGTHGERSVNIVDRSLIRVRQKEFHCVMVINGILSGADASYRVTEVCDGTHQQYSCKKNFSCVFELALCPTQTGYGYT